MRAARPPIPARAPSGSAGPATGASRPATRTERRGCRSRGGTGCGRLGATACARSSTLPAAFAAGRTATIAEMHLSADEGARAARRLVTDLQIDSVLDAGFERSEEHTSELQSLRHLVCRLLLEKKKKK